MATAQEIRDAAAAVVDAGTAFDDAKAAFDALEADVQNSIATEAAAVSAALATFNAAQDAARQGVAGWADAQQAVLDAEAARVAAVGSLALAAAEYDGQ